MKVTKTIHKQESLPLKVDFLLENRKVSSQSGKIYTPKSLLCALPDPNKHPEAYHRTLSNLIQTAPLFSDSSDCWIDLCRAHLEGFNQTNSTDALISFFKQYEPLKQKEKILKTHLPLLQTIFARLYKKINLLNPQTLVTLAKSSASLQLGNETFFASIASAFIVKGRTYSFESPVYEAENLFSLAKAYQERGFFEPNLFECIGTIAAKRLLLIKTKKETLFLRKIEEIFTSFNFLHLNFHYALKRNAAGPRTKI